MRRWTDTEYEILFRDHPPTEPDAPDLAASRAIAMRIGRTSGAVEAQWNDARSAVLGNATAASVLLIDYLQRRGWR